MLKTVLRLVWFLENDRLDRRVELVISSAQVDEVIAAARETYFQIFTAVIDPIRSLRIHNAPILARRIDVVDRGPRVFLRTCNSLSCTPGVLLRNTNEDLRPKS